MSGNNCVNSLVGWEVNIAAGNDEKRRMRCLALVCRLWHATVIGVDILQMQNSEYMYCGIFVGGVLTACGLGVPE